MKKVFIHFAFVMLLAVTCFAQKPTTIVAWNFYDQVSGGTNNLSPKDKHGDITVGGISRGKGLTTITNEKLGKYWGAKGFSLDQNGPEDGIKNEKFITFSLTTNAAKPLSLKEIKPLKIRIFSVGPINYLLQYSLDGATYKDITTAKVDRPEKQGDLQTSAIDLSGIKDLQNLASGKTVHFRIVPWGATREAYNDFYLGSAYDVPSLSITGNFK